MFWISTHLLLSVNWRNWNIYYLFYLNIAEMHYKLIHSNSIFLKHTLELSKHINIAHLNKRIASRLQAKSNFVSQLKLDTC